MSTVANGLKLHMFECGTLKCHVENIKMNQGLGEEYEIPVPWFLVEHTRGLVVIDGGNAGRMCDRRARSLGRYLRRLLADDDRSAGVRTGHEGRRL
jgi:hypothetical protein